MNATTPPPSQTDLQAAIVRHPLMVSPDTPVMEAIAQMSDMQAMDTSTQSADDVLGDRHRNVRSSYVLVVDEGHLVGSLSERDIVRLIAAQPSLENLAARAVMTGPVVSLRESAVTDLSSVMTLLQQQTQPVALLDDHDQIVGLLTLSGLLEQRVAQLEAEQLTLVEQYTAELEQQTVEKKLIDHERLYQRIIQAQTDLILRSRPDTTITFANDALCAALSRSLDDVIGLQWSSFVPPEDLEALPHKIAALTPANPSFANINRDYRANNQIGWTQWINLGIFDEREALVAIQSVGRDITGLQQQIQREQALSQVIQSIRNSLDLDAIFAIATAATAQLLDGLNCFVVKYLPEQGVWRHVAESHHNLDTPGTIGFEIADAGNPFADQLKQLQLVRVESTASLDDAINHDVAQTIPGAWLLIPLVVDGSLWGSFTITTAQQSFVWSDDQIELAQAITSQLEIAIFQANLYQQVQQELEERCQVEVALRESETRFRNMAANVPGAIFRYLLRPDGSDGVVYMSPGCYGLWEMEAQAVEANAAPLWEVIDPEDLPGMQASVLKSARTLQPWVWTWRITTPSGRRKWLEASGIPTMQANGDVIWDTLIVDVSDRKKAEAERLQTGKLRLELDLLENILNIILAGYWDWDLQNDQEYLSPGFKRMFGYEDHELPNAPETWQNLIFSDDLPGVLNCFDRHVQSHGEVPYYNEVRYRHQDGSTVWVICSGQVIEWDAADKPLRMIGCHIDITQRKQVEEELQKSDAHLKAAQRISKLGSWEFDLPTGRVTWSDEVFRIFGRDLELGAPSFEELQQQVHAGDRDLHQQTVQTAIETVQPYEIEYRLYRPDGTVRHIQARGEPIVDASGQLIQLVGTILDITERKQAELKLQQTTAQLEASNRELEAFSYSVSHDLRSPLRAIDGFSRALLEDYGEHFDEEGKDYFNRIRSNVNRMGLLIDDLLRLSRVSRSEMRYSSVNLSALVQSQVDDMQAAEPERQVTVVVAPGAIVSADATLMGVAIANLLQNAWKFTSHHATAHLEFGVIQQEGQPTYFVRDDGAGFDMAYANMLFGVFQRLHNTHEFPGTGIGLATVQRAIHRHGGRVWAEGAVEQGATIYFTVPHTSIGIGG